MLLIAIIVLAALVAGFVNAIVSPIANRQLEVAAANRQYMIDNKTAVRPYN